MTLHVCVRPFASHYRREKLYYFVAFFTWTLSIDKQQSYAHTFTTTGLSALR